MKHSNKETEFKDKITTPQKIIPKKIFFRTKLSTLSTTSDNKKKSTMFITPNNISTYTQHTLQNKYQHYKSSTYSNTLTSFFLSKSSSQNSIKAFSSSPESIYMNFPLSFPPLCKTLNNYHRTKSDFVYKGYKKINNLHRDTLKHKFNNNYKKFFLTISSTSNMRNHKDDSIDMSNSNKTNPIEHKHKSSSPMLNDVSIQIPKMLGGKFRTYPTLSYSEFTKKVLNQFKCGIICKNMKKELLYKENEIRKQIEETDKRIKNVYIQTQRINKYNEEFSAYIKFLHYRINEEFKILSKLYERKIDLEFGIKNLKEKIDQSKNIIVNMKSFKVLINNCLGCELDENISCQMFFERIKYLENKTLSNIEEFQSKCHDVIELNNEKEKIEKVLIIKEQNDCKQIMILNKKLTDLKQKHLSLLHNKKLILDEINEGNSSLIRKKQNMISNMHNNKEKDIKVEAMHFELKFENLNHENPKLYTCIAVMLSEIIHAILKLNRNFLSIQTDDNHFICTEDQLTSIIHKKYNNRNISKVREHIIIMIKIVERSYDKIVNSIKSIQSNSKEENANVKELIEHINDERKSRFVIEQKKVIERIRNEKMQRVVNKLNGLTYINKRRIFHEMDYKNANAKKKRNNSNTVKNKDQINKEEAFDMLHY